MEAKITTDCAFPSPESNVSDVSKNSVDTGDSKTESCRESKHSKQILIQDQSQCQQAPISRYLKDGRNEFMPNMRQRNPGDKNELSKNDRKNYTTIMMLASCGQLLIGLLLITFGVLVLIYGASLGSSGAGLWAGVSALIAGALGLVATLAESSSSSSSSSKGTHGSRSSGFSTSHLASSLVALALSNMSTITALTAVIRDGRFTSAESEILLLAGGDGKLVEVSPNWSGLSASIGLLLSSLVELFVAGYTCFILTPKLCGCLGDRKLKKDPESEIDAVDTAGTEFEGDIGKLKTRNMVHQWVIAQTHAPKTSTPPPPLPPPPFFFYHQPMMPIHPMIQAPYGIPHGKYPGGYLPTYGPVPMIPQMIPPPNRSHMQMYYTRPKRYSIAERGDSMERRTPRETRNEPKRMTSIGEDDHLRDLSQTYTGLDKKISEEFISIAMDPERKSKASSHHGSEIGLSSFQQINLFSIRRLSIDSIFLLNVIFI